MPTIAHRRLSVTAFKFHRALPDEEFLLGYFSPVDSSFSSSEDSEDEQQEMAPPDVVLDTPTPPWSFLGENPSLVPHEGPELHEEVVARWTVYLREGFPADSRKDLVGKYLIPSNCPALHPPKLNEEVKTILTTQIQKNDNFLCNLQEQLGAGITAIGQLLNLKLVDPNTPVTLDDQKLQKLADAAQLIASTHHALSLKRKFEIQPFLNDESRGAAQQSPIDNFLFGSEFLEKLKSCQNVRKAAEDIKKPRRTFPPAADRAGPSGSSQQHLNSKRPPFKKRWKGRNKSPAPRDQSSRKKTTEAKRDQGRRHYFYKQQSSKYHK